MGQYAHPLARIRGAALVAGQWLAVVSLFVVPINKPATNVALVLSLVCSLLGSDMRQRWRDSARNPVAQGFLVWCSVLVLSALHTWYTTSTLPLGGTFVWACWYPLVLGSLLHTPRWRQRALLAFAVAMALVLLISCGMDLGVIPQRALTLGQPAMRNTVFKEYTQQGLAMLVFGSMAMAAAMNRSSRVQRRLLLCVVALVLVNILLMVESRTTYLTLVPVAIYWLWRILLRGRIHLRSMLIAGCLAAATLVALWLTPPVHERLFASVPHEVEQYAAHRTPTSTGVRLELWRRTMPIIASAPLFGHGLGTWAPIYRSSIEGLPDSGAFLMGHPHQEMLLILSEQGIAGLAIYLLLLAALAVYVRWLEPPERDIYACVLLIYLTAGLANCLWDDFSHRHLFILLLACIPWPVQRTPPRQATTRLG